jgi:hydroxymethylpyrimidine/phosphomethylpyrimidine kinase
MPIPRVLIIAGSDSGGGAGIQADLKTVSALGCFGMTAITALTAQNTTGVYGVVEMTPEFVAQQIEVCVTDIGCDAVKTGMLANADIIAAVAEQVRKHQLQPLVVDPVMVAKSGAPLLRPDAIEALKTLLFPLATVVTPNLHEANALTGHDHSLVR